MCEKVQSAGACIPGFIDKNDHIISWNKDVLSEVSWLEKEQNSRLFHFLISADISRNDSWFVKYTWIKPDDVIN